MRANNRRNNELRPYRVEYGVQAHAAGSVMIHMGNTQVLCGVTVEERVPPFLKGSGQGWITAEYGMLPCATHGRSVREAVSGRSGRTFEIQRLIGRCLRMMVDLRQLGERTLRVDCDVINADGGTRCASITGAALALRHAVFTAVADGKMTSMPKLLPIAAISSGMVNGEVLLDLDYSEDHRAEVDANFVMSADGRWVALQSAAEGQPFTPLSFTAMAELASTGIRELLLLWAS